MYAMFIHNVQNQFISILSIKLTSINQNYHSFNQEAKYKSRSVPNALCGAPTQPGQPKRIRDAPIWREAASLRAATNAHLALFQQSTKLKQIKTMSAAPLKVLWLNLQTNSRLDSWRLGSCNRRWLQPMLGRFSAVQNSAKQQIEGKIRVLFH